MPRLATVAALNSSIVLPVAAALRQPLLMHPILDALSYLDYRATAVTEPEGGCP
jgi:hypothetical protein